MINRSEFTTLLSKQRKGLGLQNDIQLAEHENQLNESAFKDFKKQDYLPDISQLTESISEEVEEEEGVETDYDLNKIVYKSFKYEDKIWKLGVSFERDEKESFLKKVESFDPKESNENVIHLKVNLGHTFVRRFFW